MDNPIDSILAAPIAAGSAAPSVVGSTTGNPIDSILSTPPPSSPSLPNTPYNFKFDSVPSVDVLKQTYQAGGGNPALVPTDQWNVIQKKYQDASNKPPTSDIDRTSIAGGIQSLGEAAKRYTIYIAGF